MAQQKVITVGVCGGIAAYKSCELVRLFKKQGHIVRVMITEAAKHFVTPLSLQTLSEYPVATSLMDLTEESRIGHINLADESHVVVIAPATADLMAKAAQGLCDDIVSTVLLATKAPVVMAPSMNVNMLKHPATQKNIATLESFGYHIVPSEEGELACGWVGDGRLASLEAIMQKTLEVLG